MADISGRFLQLKAITPMLVGQNWETRIAADATGALFASIKGAAYTAIAGAGGSGATILGAWGTQAMAAITGKVATLTDVIFQSEMGIVQPLFATPTLGSTGSLTNDPSAFNIQSGTTANSTVTLNNAGTETFIPNLRTTKVAVAIRLTRVASANTATMDARICNLNSTGGGDIVGIGIQGSTSTVNYVIRSVGAGITNTGIAQSAPGTYDTLILILDGALTNAFIGLNGAAPTATVTQSQASLTTSPANLQVFLSNGATAANCGFKIDKMLVVVESAS